MPRIEADARDEPHVSCRTRSIRGDSATPRAHVWRRVLASVTFTAIACTSPDLAPLDELEGPSAVAGTSDGRWILVVSGNWRRAHLGGALLVLDGTRLDDALAPALAGGEGAGACRGRTSEGPVRCDASRLLRPELGLRWGSEPGNVVIDERVPGRARVLATLRDPASLVWADVTRDEDGDAFALECGQGVDRVCSDAFTLALGADPSRLTLEPGGWGFAYVPHLSGRRVTLLDVTPPDGPLILDDDTTMFREEPNFGSGLGGAYAIVSRPCDLDTGNVPALSNDCTRPVLYGSERYVFGLRQFRVAPGLKILLQGASPELFAPDEAAIAPRPTFADLAFADPTIGDDLLVVRTAPPALGRIDTSLDEDGFLDEVFETAVPLCADPHALAVVAPSDAMPDARSLALVTCHAGDALAIVDLETFSVIRTLPVGDGPNALWIDEGRRLVWVALVDGDGLALVDVDPTRASYLDVVAEIR